jgi:hypothetical protein
MNKQMKEWTINGLLLLGIAGFIVLIGLDRFSADKQSPLAGPNGTDKQGADPVGTETTYAPARDADPFPLFGKMDIFRDLVTPTPTPPPPTPKPTPTPSISDVIGNWVFSYPIQSRKQFVFTEGNREFILVEGVGQIFRDKKGMNIEITARSTGRYSVVLEGAGQSKEFSLK